MPHVDSQPPMPSPTARYPADQGFVPPMTPKQAAAQARAAKAHAKALRPWFKKKWFMVPLVLAALIALSVIVSGGGGSEPTTSVAGNGDGVAGNVDGAAAAGSGEEKAAALAQVGDSVRSGDLVFTITKVRTGVESVGNEYVGEKPQGQFVLVSVTAENVGEEAATLWGFDHKLVDSKEREFSIDEVAGLYVSDANALAEEINPGNVAKGTLVFDMPKGVKPVEAHLSGGLIAEPAVFSLKD